MHVYPKELSKSTLAQVPRNSITSVSAKNPFTKTLMPKHLPDNKTHVIQVNNSLQSFQTHRTLGNSSCSACSTQQYRQNFANPHHKQLRASLLPSSITNQATPRRIGTSSFNNAPFTPKNHKSSNAQQQRTSSINCSQHKKNKKLLVTTKYYYTNCQSHAGRSHTHTQVCTRKQLNQTKIRLVYQKRP